ncbi:helix-turn-helix transcriptional regulator [Candidatus Bathyarchaeota archaeon]|nr:helix-turn-helix transcriptional regulator [Candidatus Bathyarchaeota archaeon]
MCPHLALNDQIVQLIESRMKSTLEGIEETFRYVLDSHKIGLEEQKETVQELEESFMLLSEKWNLQILFTLFLQGTMGFNGFRKILNVNSRTLSDKLKSLRENGFVKRFVAKEPPFRVRYSLTTQGRNVILLALPLLYYTRSFLTKKLDFE